MGEFFSFLKMVMICGTVFFITITVLLSLPQSKLRCVGLEISKWAMACGLVLLVPTTVDALPDVIPVAGWIDDIGYIAGAIGAAKSALGDRRKRISLEELEFEQLRSGLETHQVPQGDDHEEAA